MTITKPRLQPLYSVADLAAMLGMSKKCVRRLLRAKGVKPVLDDGSKWQVALSELCEKVWPVLDSWQLAELARKAHEGDAES